MTSKQEEAFECLKILLRDLFENIHGPRSWGITQDELLETIVKDLSGESLN